MFNETFKWKLGKLFENFPQYYMLSRGPPPPIFGIQNYSILRWLACIERLQTNLCQELCFKIQYLAFRFSNISDTPIVNECM